MLTICKAREQVTVSSTAIGLTTTNFTRSGKSTTQPAWKTAYAEIQVTGANVRVRFDGTNPTTSIGRIWYAGDTYRVWGIQNLENINFIRDDATDATLEVDYFGGSAN